MTGSRNFRLFYPPWLEPFARGISAIVISADYRLLPESNPTEILEDLESLWSWLHSTFPTTLNEISGGKHRADPANIILNGGSAGGWCALHQAIKHPDEVRALMLQYPGVGRGDENVDPEDPRNAEKKYMGMPVWSRAQLDRYLEGLKYNEPVTEGGAERIPFFLAAKAWGLLAQWRRGTAGPLELIKDGAKLPPKM